MRIRLEPEFKPENFHALIELNTIQPEDKLEYKIVKHNMLTKNNNKYYFIVKDYNTMFTIIDMIKRDKTKFKKMIKSILNEILSVLDNNKKQDLIDINGNVELIFIVKNEKVKNQIRKKLLEIKDNSEIVSSNTNDINNDNEILRAVEIFDVNNDRFFQMHLDDIFDNIKISDEVLTYFKLFNPITILMVGLYGTGKTTSVKLFARVNNYDKLIKVNIHQLYSRYLGETEKKVYQLLYNTIPSIINDNDKCIIFIDEMDKYMSKIQDTDSAANSTINRTIAIFSEWLSEYFKPTIYKNNPDKVKLFISVNFIDKLDELLLRPGRIDYIVSFNMLNLLENNHRQFIIHSLHNKLNMKSNEDKILNEFINKLIDNNITYLSLADLTVIKRLLKKILINKNETSSLIDLAIRHTPFTCKTISELIDIEQYEESISKYPRYLDFNNI